MNGHALPWHHTPLSCMKEPKGQAALCEVKVYCSYLLCPSLPVSLHCPDGMLKLGRYSLREINAIFQICIVSK